MHVDDLPGGSTDDKKGFEFYQQAKQIMKKGDSSFGNGDQTVTPYSEFVRQKG